MDAFKNYQNLMGEIGENTNQMQRNAKTRAVFNAKSRTDEIVKAVGEAKLFISGKPLLKKVGEYVKPKIKEGIQDIRDEVESRVKAKIAEEPAQNADVIANSQGPTRLEALENRLGSRVRGKAAGREANDEGESIQMDDIGASKGGVEIQNRAFDPNEASGTTETSAGADTADATLSGGFNTSSGGVFDSVMSQSRGSNLQNPFANARQNKFNPSREDGQSNSTPRSTPEDPVIETADAPVEATQAGASEGGALLDGAEQTAKVVAEKGIESVGETASGILDAIPGGELFGVVLGGLMAGIAAHKGKKAEEMEKEDDKSTASPASFSYQAGVGGE